MRTFCRWRWEASWARQGSFWIFSIASAGGAARSIIVVAPSDHLWSVGRNMRRSTVFDTATPARFQMAPLAAYTFRSAREEADCQHRKAHHHAKMPKQELALVHETVHQDRLRIQNTQQRLDGHVRPKNALQRDQNHADVAVLSVLVVVVVVVIINPPIHCITKEIVELG